MAQGFTKNQPLDNDVTLSSDSQYIAPTVHAVKTYVDNSVTNSDSGGAWLYDANGNRTHYASLTAAAAAAGTGDIVHLFPGTYTLTSQLAYGSAFAIEGEGPETIINCATNGILLLLLDSSGAALRNLKITHSGAGVLNSGISVSASATIENVTVSLTGASTSNFAIYHYGGTLTMINVTSTSTGATNKYAYYNDTADVTATIAGGSLSGATADIYSDRTGSTINLAGVALLNNIMVNQAATSGNCLDSKYRNAGFITVNNSGATRAAGDVGDIDSAGKLTTTTTATAALIWTVVSIGNTSGNQVFVRRQSKVTVKYTGTAPNAGDYLVTSTSAGLAQQQTTMRPEIFAVCTAAGSGGLVEAVLLCGRVPTGQTSTNNLYELNTNAPNSDFRATINGAPSGTSVVYNAPSSGAAVCIQPSASTQLAKLRLYNETRGTYALVSSVNTGTSTITLTATFPAGWASGDTITARSQTNTSNPSAGVYFFDYEITSEVSALAVSIESAAASMLDTGAAGINLFVHPWETSVTSKRSVLNTQVANVTFRGAIEPMPLISNRFCVAWQASGTTFSYTLRLWRVTVAAP